MVHSNEKRPIVFTLWEVGSGSHYGNESRAG